MGVNQKRTKMRRRTHTPKGKQRQSNIMVQLQRNALALLEVCPVCKAQPEEKCTRNYAGQVLKEVHPERLALVRVIHVPGGSW